MHVILSDEQTLVKWPNGLHLEVTDVEVYRAEGFWFDFFTLDCSSIDDELFLVKKCISDDVFDLFICYRPFDIDFAGREKFEFLFNADESYSDVLILNEKIVYNCSLCVDVEVSIMDDIKPGKAAQYQSDDSQENPFIFAFEAINEITAESFVSYIQGCRVNEKEVEFL